METACALLQQEELQQEVLFDAQLDLESSALLSKGSDGKCTQCGNKGHARDKCWQVIGYPSWYPRSK